MLASFNWPLLSRRQHNEAHLCCVFTCRVEWVWARPTTHVSVYQAACKSWDQTLSGKTTWLSKLIQDAATHFRDDTGDSAHFQQALHCYGSSWQPMFRRMQQDLGVTFHPWIPPIPWEEVFLLEQHLSLLLLDDLMRETVDSHQVMDLLRKKARHLNLFVTVIKQNLYALDVVLEWILFRNPAATCYIKTLGQRWMDNAKHFMPLFEQATTPPYGCLVVDHHPQCNKRWTMGYWSSKTHQTTLNHVNTGVK